MPEYLSENTIKEVEELNCETDEIISEGKIEDVLFYFEKVNKEEKEECLRKIMNELEN